MYHMKEANVAVKTFHFYVSMEAFTYLCYKAPHAIKATVTKKESIVVYYNTLEMELEVAKLQKCIFDAWIRDNHGKWKAKLSRSRRFSPSCH
jgi:hypothetical protein